MDRTIFSSIKRKNTDKDFCSFEIRHDGVVFAHVSIDNPSQKINLKQVGLYPYNDITHLEFSLHEIVEKYGLQEMNCNIILHPRDYRLLLVNKPEVPTSEYRSALKWMIKDMVDYPLEDLTIDIFAPSGLSENTAKKLYVVATQTSLVQRIFDIATRTLLKPIAIDIREFAIRNLLTKVISDKESIIFLHPNQISSLLLTINKHMLYFARQIPAGLDILSSNSLELEREIHNSLDYYATELKQNIPTKLLIAPTLEKNQQLFLLALQKVVENVSFLDINALIEPSITLTIDQQMQTYIAIGGALRK